MTRQRARQSDLATRPCRQPLGGCGKPVAFIPTGRYRDDGRPVTFVVDPTPERRIVVGEPISVDAPDDGVVVGHRHPGPGHNTVVGRQVHTWVDHHATCEAWARWQAQGGGRTPR